MRYTLLIVGFLVIILIITFIGLYRYANESHRNIVALSCTSSTGESPYKISSATAKQLLAANRFAGVLDVRTTAEREVLGYLPGSYHIPAVDLDVIVPQMFPDKSVHLLIYCNTGQRARKAAEKLHAIGYKNAVYITGSYKDLVV